MKSKLKSVRDGSLKAPGSQPQKPNAAKGRAKDRPKFPPSCIALFVRGDCSLSDEVIDLTKAEYAALKQAAALTGSGILMFMANAALALVGYSGRKAHHTKGISGDASGFCLYDMEVGEVVVKLPQVERELYPMLIAALGQRITVGQFISDAIKEKLAAWKSTHRKEGAS